LIFK
jgi:hypothetical protein